MGSILSKIRVFFENIKAKTEFVLKDIDELNLIKNKSHLRKKFVNGFYDTKK